MMLRIVFVLALVLICEGVESVPKSSDYYASIGPADEYIVNGVNARKGEWPWTLSLQVRDPQTNFSRHVCGASLLNAQHAMTAAHCLDGFFPDLDFRVVIGASDLGTPENDTDSDREDVVDIAAAYLHEDYGCENCSGAFPNDIAIIYLERPTVFNEFVLPAILASPENDVDYESADCYIVGWGRTDAEDPDSPPLQLQEALMEVLDTASCRDLMPLPSGERVQDEMVCAWDPRDVPNDAKRGICQGDAGGPVQCELGDQWHVLGAASWVVGGFGEYQCNPQFPSVFTRVSAYRDWIDAVLADDSWKPQSEWSF